MAENVKHLIFNIKKSEGTVREHVATVRAITKKFKRLRSITIKYDVKGATRSKTMFERMDSFLDVNGEEVTGDWAEAAKREDEREVSRVWVLT